MSTFHGLALKIVGYGARQQIIKAVAGAECNTVIELMLEHHAA